MGALLESAKNKSATLNNQSTELDGVVKTLKSIVDDLSAANNEPSINISIQKLSDTSTSLQNASEKLVATGDLLVSTAEEIELEEAETALITRKKEAQNKINAQKGGYIATVE